MTPVEEIVAFEKDFTTKPTDGMVCLNLGCGARVFEGWNNIDLYHDSPDIVKGDIGNLPWSDNSVDKIFSAHSLEHIPIRTSYRNLKHWSDKLRIGGELLLSVPDLKEICRQLYENDEVMTDNMWYWTLCTLFGYQAQPSTIFFLDQSSDPGQYHQTGWTLHRLIRALQNYGMRIVQTWVYDGYGTPSIAVYAVKK